MGCAWRSRKLQSVSAAARGRYWDCISFCADNATGGHITGTELSALKRGDRNAFRQFRELVTAGLLEPDGEGYRVHDFADWNAVADAQANAQANAQADAQADADALANALADAQANALANASPPTNSNTYDPPFKTQDPRPIKSALSESWRLVGREYATRFEQATTLPVPLDLHRRHFEAVAHQASPGGDLDLKLVRSSLDRFWADRWAEANRWPVAAWAKQFARHAAPDPRDKAAEIQAAMAEARREMGLANG